MSTRLKVMTTFIAVIAVLAVGYKLAQPKIASYLMHRTTMKNAGFDRTTVLPDGIHVFICGAGSPMPDPKRSGPCTGIVAGNKVFVVDTGGGSIGNLGRMGFPLGRVDAALLTHLHSDHVDGLGEFLLQSWINGSRKTPTPVIGPVGTETVVEGFNAAYRLDSTYRTAHHGTEIADPQGFGGETREFSVGAIAETILEEDDLKITAVAVHHNPVEPAVGYRFDYKDRSVTLSGDTIYHPGLVAVAKGTDLLVHEALNIEMVEILRGALENKDLDNLAKVMFDIQDYHATPVDAARAANDAEVDALLLNHIVPPLPLKMLYPLFLQGTENEFDGTITIAEDGQIFSLPSDSDEIIHSKGFGF